FTRSHTRIDFIGSQSANDCSRREDPCSRAGGRQTGAKGLELAASCVTDRGARIETREMPELQPSQYKKSQVVGSVRKGWSSSRPRCHANPTGSRHPLKKDSSRIGPNTTPNIIASTS